MPRVSYSRTKRGKHELRRMRREDVLSFIDLAIKSNNPVQRMHAIRLDARALRARNVFPRLLREKGLSALQMKMLGFSPRELVKEAGFGLSELKDLNFRAREWRASKIFPSEKRIVLALLGAGYGFARLSKAGFPKQAIERACRAKFSSTLKKVRMLGITMRNINDAKGILMEQLHTRAGFRKHNLSVRDLRLLGFELRDLAYRFYPQDLLEGGFTPTNLLHAGYSQEEINKAIRMLRKKAK